MERSKLRSTASTLKWLIATALMLPLIGYGAINTFDLIVGSRIDIDNVRIDGNTISTTNSNGDLTFDMNGTGRPLFSDLTATTVPYLDSSKKIQSSAVTPTELGYVSGVTASLCGISQSCTITNKTIDADSNTITNIENADIKAAAAIALNKLAATTVSRALVSDGSGFVSPATTTATEIGYVNGVTSAIQTQINTKAPTASPTFTGTITRNGATSGAITFAVPATITGYTITWPNAQGGASTFLANDGSGGLSWATQTAAPSASYESSNCSIAATVAGSALTIALKDSSGSDPSGGSPCKISFRNATAATGTYTQVSTTAAVSVVAANGDSIGCPTAAVQCVISVYAINNAGTVVLGMLVGGVLDEGSVQTSVALTGGADTASSTLWSTAAQASKAVRLIGRVTITPAAAFAWTNAVTEISLPPFVQTPWYINANITGANPSLGTSAVTAYTEIIDAGLTMTPIAGSAPVGVMCSTTNAATAPTTSTSTCAAGSESLGANFAIPSPGVYEVCVQASWEGQVDTTERFDVGFEVIETPTNAQTLTLEGGGRIVQGCGFTATGGVDMICDLPVAVCSVFNWTSAAAGTVKGVRLMFEQAVTGTVDASSMLMDGTANPGQYAFHIRARRM